jgi:hypothetical protein
MSRNLVHKLTLVKAFKTGYQCDITKFNPSLFHIFMVIDSVENKYIFEEKK